MLKPNRKCAAVVFTTSDFRLGRREAALRLLHFVAKSFSLHFTPFSSQFSKFGFIGVCFKMVKVSFNSALSQKDVKKDAETLIPEEDKVSRKWLTVTSRANSSGFGSSSFWVVRRVSWRLYTLYSREENPQGVFRFGLVTFHLHVLF